MTENNNLDTKENTEDEENKLFFKSFSDFKDFIENSKYSIKSISENEIIFKFDDKDQTTNFFTMVIDEDVEALLKLKDNLELAKKELNEKLLRLAAEFENYKKRNLIEKKQATYIAKENMLRDLLFFIDNFERGLNLYENTQYLPSHIVTSSGPPISTPELVASAPVIEHNKPPLKITVQ